MNTLETIKSALTEMNLETYLAKKSSLGHCYVSALVGSKLGDVVLSDSRFTTLNVPCAKSFNKLGYIQHIVLA